MVWSERLKIVVVKMIVHESGVCLPCDDFGYFVLPGDSYVDSCATFHEGRNANDAVSTLVTGLQRFLDDSREYFLVALTVLRGSRQCFKGNFCFG